MATSTPITNRDIGLKKNMCIKYIPKDSLLTSDTKRGVLPFIQLKTRNIPKVDSNKLGVQNSHPHSNSIEGSITPGTPFHQKDQAVKAEPRTKQAVPIHKRRDRLQLI